MLSKILSKGDSIAEPPAVTVRQRTGFAGEKPDTDQGSQIDFRSSLFNEKNDPFETPTEKKNPFRTPSVSIRSSRQNSYLPPSVSAPSLPVDEGRGRPYFRSRRIKKGETWRPELHEYDPREKWVTIIPVTGIVIGFCIIGFLAFWGYHGVPKHKYCNVLYDDFSGGFRNYWEQEVQCGGFGNGEFELTTTNNENAFIRDGQLVLKATLVNETLITTDSITNLTADGTCTTTELDECVISSNYSSQYIINPVHSARINTKQSVGITYGRVEVTAKLARGDWLAPSIWMLPMNNTYGAWPKSGEIDIAMSRGNNYSYPSGGNNIVSSIMHWGPESDMDGWWRTNKNESALHKTWSDDFNTFGLEWSQKYLFTYINSRLLQVLYTPFSEPWFELGNFAAADSDGDIVTNPWADTGRVQTPFDQEFYLILSLAVGGTSGWFVDGEDSKPWVDSDDITSRYDFWAARDQWYPTWEGGGGAEMVISKVAMWQQCDD